MKNSFTKKAPTIIKPSQVAPKAKPSTTVTAVTPKGAPVSVTTGGIKTTVDKAAVSEAKAAVSEAKVPASEVKVPAVVTTQSPGVIIDSIDVESRPVKWLSDQLAGKLLIVDHSFQRNAVWSKKDQVGLVETVLLGMPIPEVYLWHTSTNAETGDVVYSIVDGQQRLNAITSFVNGEFSLQSAYLDHKNAAYVDKKFSELPQEMKNVIWRYRFAIRFMKSSLKRSEIIEIFLRLNRTNTPLNQQELRHAAFSGKFSDQINDILDNCFWEDNSVFSASDVRRMLDAQFVATLLIFLREGVDTTTDQKTISEFYRIYDKVYAEKQADFTAVTKNLEVITELANGRENLTKAIKRKTHLYTLFTLVEGYRVKGSMPAKAGERLDTFFGKQSTKDRFAQPKANSLLDDYSALSLEGVQQKANRERRLQILQEYLEQK